MQEDLLGKSCDHQVSKQAWNCPHYGQPSPTEEIKAYLDFRRKRLPVDAIVLIVFVVVTWTMFYPVYLVNMTATLNNSKHYWSVSLKDNTKLI